MSSSIISFYAIGVIGLISALVVASSLNPIHRIAFLILVFLSGSFIMIILDFYFLGLTYIIVYVGAIMILFLFVIMMVQIHLMPITSSITPRIYNANSPVSALDEDMRKGRRMGMHTRFILLLVPLFSFSFFYFLYPNTIGGGNMIVNYFYTSWFIEFKTMTDLETLANILYLGYPTALLLIGVALWVVLIGIIKVTASKA